MTLTIKDQKLTKSALESGKFTKNKFSDSDECVVKLAKAWLSGEKIFRICTSGSTGKPKEIMLKRVVLEYSATTSMNFLDPERRFRSSLLCINPLFIGGIMVVVRALMFDHDLTVIDPASDPLVAIGAETFDLVSMVPLQVQTVLDRHTDQLSQFRTVLIGGAPLAGRYLEILKKVDTRCFHTYGMTETASHVALKDLSKTDDLFHTLGDMALETDDRSCLKLNGTVTDHQWLQTNDVVELHGHNAFRWLGRADFVINSGGYKVFPEALEQKIGTLIKEPFFIAGVPDERLGEKVVLVVEAPDREVHPDITSWHTYEKPKEIYTLPHFVYTPSGKINREETLKLIIG